MKRLTFAALLTLAACGDAKKAVDKHLPDSDGPGPYALEYSDVMEFTRGVAGSYKIAGGFSLDDTSTITLDGLPDGAEFDGEQLTWTPSCTLSPQNGQFARGYQVYRLRINLEGSRSDNIVQKPALILVHLTGEGSTCEDS